MLGRDFIEVAKQLVRKRFEAGLRSAISRAYYALFNSAAQFLRELGFSVEKAPSAHQSVRSLLNNSSNQQIIQFSKTLDELRTLRNEADYNMSSNEFQQQAICALRIADAELALDLLINNNKEPQRSQIRASIREYERKVGR